MSSLFLLNTLMVGGSAKKSIRIANALNKRGHTMHIAYLNEPSTLLSEVDSSISTFFIDRKQRLDFVAFSKLRNYIFERKIKTILCINLYPSLYGVAVKKISENTRVNCLTFVNITDFQNNKEKIQMPVYWFALKGSEKIIFGCESQRKQWVSRYFLPEHKTSVIYNGVDCEFFSPSAISAPPEKLREKYSLPQEDIIITCVAELRPEKGHRDLITAFARLARKGPPVRLVLAGDGPERTVLETLADALGVKERVHFLGRIKDVRPVLCITDIFTLASTAVETFSNAALEAMAMRKPVLISDIGGAREMVREGENGYLFRAKHVEELERRLAAMIEAPLSRKEMGHRALELVRKRFHFTAMLDQYEQLILSQPDQPRAKTDGQGIHHLSI